MIFWLMIRHLLVRQYRVVGDHLERLRLRLRLKSPLQWPHYILFIAGLLKSGTSWMAQLLTQVEGYRVRRPVDPDKRTLSHDVCDDVFASMPGDLYSILKLHARAKPHNLQVIKRHTLKTVVIYRDPRDKCVSRYFHFLADPSHWHNKVLRWLVFSGLAFGQDYK